MSLAVDTGRRLRVGRLDEAENLALGLAHPVALVVDVVVALNGDVLGVSVADGVAGNAPSMLCISMKSGTRYLLEGTRRCYRSAALRQGNFASPS